MISQDANKLVEKIQKEAKDNGFGDSLIKMLKDLRPFALEESDPLVTRSIRICYEFIESTEGFDIPLPEEAEIEGEPSELFDYICGLWLKSENKYNRDELRELADEMTNSY
jgi:hypothetical protein